MSVEVSRTLPSGFAVSVGGGLTLFSPWGDIPTPNTMSEAYQEWIAPDLSLYGTEAMTKTGALTILWHARDGLSLWEQGMLAGLSPLTGSAHLEHQPEGPRSRSRVQVGVTMGG